MRNFYTTVSIILLLTATCSYSSYAQVYPADFAQVLVATPIQSPTAMDFAPDGRIFVALQGGSVRVIKNNTLLATPFVTVTVSEEGERGLVGIVVDPDFLTNHYVYIYYAVPDVNVPGSPAHNRIVRFTANGDVAQAGSETIILELDPLSTSNIHNGGAMHFGKDGKLYVAVGENANGPAAQNLDTYHGKLLRINKDGSVPAGNPFTTGSAQRRRVWAYGLRNPFTFAVDPQTGRIFVNDVGGNTWEEINDATTGGRNFGWPTTEGSFNQSTYPNFTNPIYVYAHGTGDVNGCAITGGTFFNPVTTNYPAVYAGRYFYRDFCNNWINSLDLSGPSAVRSPFASSVPGGGISIATGNDGNLYFLSRSTRSLYKIIYNQTTAPFITNQPANLVIAEGQQATFSVTALGSAPLAYQWQKNGVNIPGATNATLTINNAVPANNGVYRVIVSNAVGNATSTGATLSVVSSAIPVAEIITPVLGTTYVAGTTISFSGSGTDAEGDPLPVTALSWSINFHHNTHHHDQPPINGVSGGSFVVPTVGETSDNVWYRIILTVTDATGLKGKDSVDVHPLKSTLNFTTSPPGLQVTLDGQPLVTPASVVSVEGILRSIGIITPQVKDGVIYTFESWAHGGAPTQTLATPANDLTLTAQYSATPTIFYRAINLNGPALSIDGNNWEASANAPNFTYTTDRGLFANQAIPLVPATDANRATMIRSSIWGKNVTLNVGSVPAGSYQVWVYVWEDNFATTYSISLEGTVVQANYNSGGAGIWRKLGPFQATINDGAINVSGTGGDVVFSGIEIWGISAPGGNHPPVVSNAIANQTATAGTAFSFTFPANTFSDPDAGTVLTYSATLSSGGALPGWLGFNATTRHFTGTPGSGNIGTLDVRVTASDGAGGSVSDDFALAVNAAGGSAVFYRALNLNGPALVIDGHNWEAMLGAPNFSYTTNRWLFANQSITLVPATDANRATMIRSSIWGESVTLTVGGVPAGTYQVWVYVWEDSSPQIFSVSMEGTVVKANHNSGGPGIWSKLGPFQATINDGAINLSFTGPGYAQPSGLEIWSSGNHPPVVSNAIANQTATVGTAFNFTFPANTFSDPDAGTILTYSATLSSGGALPGWLGFNATTRSFSGTPGSGNTGTLDVRVTASDGAGGSVSDDFALAVNPAGGSTVFYRALNLNGPALLIDGHNWEASANAPNFTYTTDRGLFANQAITLIPATDANRASMIRSSIWGKNVALTVSSVPAGAYQVWVYVWEDNFATTYSISFEGSVVQANYNSGSAGIWNKLGPFQATINDGAINVAGAGGDVVFSGLEIWGINQQAGGRSAFVTGTEMVEESGEGLQLSAYPNPFSGKVNIAFTTRESAATQLAIYDIRGVRVRVLLEGNLLAGKSERLEVEAGDMPDGVYVLQLVNGQQVKHFKLSIVR